MKKVILMVCALGLLFAGVAVASDKAMSLKAGDQVYVCGCGASCDCGTLSLKPGKCMCDKDLVQGTVKSVAQDSAVIVVNGKEQTFKTVGKYGASCGNTCGCNLISQKPGKCTCGMDMKELK